MVTEREATGHAETNLVRYAAAAHTGPELAVSTLYTNTEPCTMSCGAIYWAGIGRVVYALPEQALIAMVPIGSAASTRAVPCPNVFGRGAPPTRVICPIDVPGAVAVHDGFWV